MLFLVAVAGERRRQDVRMALALVVLIASPLFTEAVLPQTVLRLLLSKK
jgi:hypothetical protein